MSRKQPELVRALQEDERRDVEDAIAEAIAALRRTPAGRELLNMSAKDVLNKFKLN